MTAYNDTLTELTNLLDVDAPSHSMLNIATELVNLLDADLSQQTMPEAFVELTNLLDSVASTPSANLYDILTLDDSNIISGALAIAALEAINMLDSNTGQAVSPVYSGISVSDSIYDALISNITEQLALSSLLSSSASRSMELSDDITVKSLIKIALDGIILENIQESDSVVSLLTKFSNIYDTLSLADSSASRASLTITIASALSLYSIISLGQIVGLLSDSLTIDDPVVDIFNAATAIVDALSVDDIPTNSVKLVAIGIDDLGLADSSSYTSIFSSTLSEDIAFIVTLNRAGVVYQGITMNPETYSITEYDNYSFNSTTNFSGTYLLAGPSGLYKMEGSTDDGAYITSKIKTASIDFGTSNIKQVPKMYLGIDNDASLILRVSVDGKYTTSYQLDVDSNDLSTQIFNIGKGLKGRYWQFELSTKGSSMFNLDEIELFPIQWGRKR